jgi:hypothetical protein
MGARETRSGTHHVETYARDEGSHAHRHPPGCNRADDSSLAIFLKTAKQDKSEDTRDMAAERLTMIEKQSCGEFSMEGREYDSSSLPLNLDACV